jgi:hypothetical protein
MTAEKPGLLCIFMLCSMGNESAWVAPSPVIILIKYGHYE